MNNDNTKPILPGIIGKPKEKEYAPVFLFESIYCASCGYLVSAADIIVCRDEQELLTRAESEHSKAMKTKNQICFGEILITYKNAFLDANAMLKMAQNQASGK